MRLSSGLYVHMYTHVLAHTCAHVHRHREAQRLEWHRRDRDRAVGQKCCLSLFSKRDRLFWVILLPLGLPPLPLPGSCGLCFLLNDEETPVAGYTEQLRQLRGSSLKARGAMTHWWSSGAVNTNEGTFTPRESQALLLRKPLAKYKKSFFSLKIEMAVIAE